MCQECEEHQQSSNESESVIDTIRTKGDFIPPQDRLVAPGLSEFHKGRPVGERVVRRGSTIVPSN
jgi:hypothetical protein